MRTITNAENITGLDRRRIQEYEKAGIAIKPSQRNNYGYWLYSDEMMDRLWQIRFCIEGGCSKAEMKEIFSSPSYNFGKALDKQIELLQKKRTEIDDLIGVAQLMKRDFLSPEAIQNQALGLEKVNYKESVGFWGALSRTIDRNNIEEDPAADEDDGLVEQRLSAVLALHASGVAANDPTAQAAVEAFLEAAKPWLSESPVAASFAIFTLFPPESGTARELDAEYGCGAAKFLCDTVREYARTGADRAVFEALDTIIELGKKKLKPWADAVQREVEKLSTYYDSFPESSAKEILPELSKLFSDPGYYLVFDKQMRARGAGKYISNALSVYCDRTPTLTSNLGGKHEKKEVF